jgi:cobalt-zinc-cadmium efflux system outer membrane protein
VQAARDRLAQQRQVIRLYDERILPTAQRSLQSAQANYTAGKLDFLRLIDAQRQFHSQREKYYAALADYQRRRAELERAVGDPLPGAIATQ